MSTSNGHNYPKLILDFEDNEVYEKNKDICICDKSLPLHYAIVSQILVMDNNQIPIIKNYSCLYCYNKFHKRSGNGFGNENEFGNKNKNENEKNNKSISIDEIKTILNSSPKNILEVKNKYGDTPLEIINKFLRILQFECDNPYNKSYTDREIRYYIGILEDINEILKS
jgi:hypothetical protein